MKKKVLAALLAVCMLASLMFIPASAAGFDDVADDHWAKEAIERWADFGVLNGVGGGNFSPDRAMNRAEFAKMVVELMGFTAKSGKTFPDVEADSSLDWAKDYIDIAATNGIIGGYPDGSFGGKREVTFEGGATMLGRALGLVTIDETSGDNYATGAANKLDELGMLDDNVKVGMTFDRAGVAGLANNMIGAYVTEGNTSETEDGVITGEVPGVILVKGNVSVEIKDATVAAPIVVLGASVELTGTTTAPAVKVAGEKASVTAGADTKIETVSVEGTDATVKLDGEVTSVTVAEDATVAEITGEGVSADNVTNNSAAEIEVNGEPVAPAGTEPAGPDDGQGDMTGFVPNPPTRPTDPAGPAPEGDHVHEYTSVVTTPATCMAEGVRTFTCANTDEKCQKVTYTEAIPKTEHTWGTTEEDGTGDNDGQKVYKCTVVGCSAEKPVAHTCPTANEIDESNTTVKEIPATCAAKGSKTTYCKVCQAVLKTEDIAISTTHGEKEALPAVAATCTKTGLTAGERCKVCGKVTTEQEKTNVDPEAHVVDDSSVWQHNDTKHWNVCTENRAHHANEADHTWGAWTTTDAPSGITVPAGKVYQTATCDVCSATKSQIVDDPDGGDDADTHTHEWASGWTKDSTAHWHACTKADGCTITGGATANPGEVIGENGYAVHGNWTPDSETAGNTKCGTCGYSTTCPGHVYDKTAETPTGKCTLCDTSCTHTSDFNNASDPGDYTCATCGLKKTIPTE